MQRGLVPSVRQVWLSQEAERHAASSDALLLPPPSDPPPGRAAGVKVTSGGVASVRRGAGRSVVLDVEGELAAVGEGG